VGTGAGSAVAWATAQSEQPGLAGSLAVWICNAWVAPTNRIRSTHKSTTRILGVWLWPLRLGRNDFILGVGCAELGRRMNSQSRIQGSIKSRIVYLFDANSQIECVSMTFRGSTEFRRIFQHMLYVRPRKVLIVYRLGPIATTNLGWLAQEPVTETKDLEPLGVVPLS
jgi:hypothetical protein